MSKIVVDTNVLSSLFAGKEEIAEKLEVYDEIMVPFIVVGELYAGYRIGNKFQDNEKAFNNFLANPNVVLLNANEETPQIYGELFAFLRKQGRPIPINDIWIAALTLQSGLQLFTLDSDFKNLPQLRLI